MVICQEISLIFLSVLKCGVLSSIPFPAQFLKLLAEAHPQGRGGEGAGSSDPGSTNIVIAPGKCKPHEDKGHICLLTCVHSAWPGAWHTANAQRCVT